MDGMVVTVFGRARSSPGCPGIFCDLRKSGNCNRGLKLEIQRSAPVIIHPHPSNTSLSPSTMAKNVNLQSNDKEGEARTFCIDVEAAKRSITLKNLMEAMPDEDDDTPTIPLPNVSGPVLEKIMAYLKHVHDNPDPDYDKVSEVDRRSADIPEWEKAFCDSVNMETLFNLILAANYLDIRSLLDVTCKTVANMIKGKTPTEIKALFGVTREFTPEEEEQVKRENPWLVETK